jgi:integrase
MRVIRRKQAENSRWAVSLVDDTDTPIEVVERFLAHLGARGCSPNTQKAYAYDLLRFWRFLEAEALTWDSFGSTDALNLLEHLRTVPSARSAQRLGVSMAVPVATGSARLLSPATVNRVIAAISSFYDYVSLAGLLNGVNPIEKRPDPSRWRVSERHRPFLEGISRQKPMRRSIRVRVPERLPRPLSGFREQWNVKCGYRF